MNIKCYCGGGKTLVHRVGEKTCFREIVPTKEEPKFAGHGSFMRSDCLMWHYEGAIITEFSLKNQRLVVMDERTGMWTRPKDRSSKNSLDA